MDKCYRCNEVISMCPCDESTYTADDEISRLRAELDSMTASRKAAAAWGELWRVRCASAVDELAVASAELAECKRDAERYRWLRDPACTHPHIANDCAGDDMDRAFDRVMGKAALAAKGDE